MSVSHWQIQLICERWGGCILFGEVVQRDGKTDGQAGCQGYLSISQRSEMTHPQTCSSSKWEVGSPDYQKTSGHTVAFILYFTSVLGLSVILVWCVGTESYYFLLTNEKPKMYKILRNVCGGYVCIGSQSGVSFNEMQINAVSTNLLCTATTDRASVSTLHWLCPEVCWLNDVKNIP